jgi:hypothetical protein
MLTTQLKLVPPVLLPEAESAPPVRLSIQGRHGVFLVQRDAEEVMVNATDPAAPHCTCHPRQGSGAAPGECAHISLLRACGFLARAA